MRVWSPNPSPARLARLSRISLFLADENPFSSGGSAFLPFQRFLWISTDWGKSTSIYERHVSKSLRLFGSSSLPTFAETRLLPDLMAELIGALSGRDRRPCFMHSVQRYLCHREEPGWQQFDLPNLITFLPSECFEFADTLRLHFFRLYRQPHIPSVTVFQGWWHYTCLLAC